MDGNYYKLPLVDLSDVKVGDRMIRLLGGVVPVEVIVGIVNETTFKVGSADGVISVEDGWTFSKKTGAEIDEDLGWDGETHTGSFISKKL